MVDWQRLAAAPCYPVAVDYTAFVGQLTGYLIKEMRLDKIHIIGFSLGAYVAATAGRMNGGKVFRITGTTNVVFCPLFTYFLGLDPPPYKLNESLTLAVALNVDVIHTSLLGNYKPLGHADFYVNGGKRQPGCKTTNRNFTNDFVLLPANLSLF